MPRDALPPERMAFSQTITKRLSAMRLQTARQQLNEGKLTRPASALPVAHPALDWIDREEQKLKTAEQNGRLAGPIPPSWVAPPSSAVGAHTPEGRKARQGLRPYPIQIQAHTNPEGSRLVDACLHHVVHALSAGDEETILALDCLQVHLKEALMRVAAVEAPLNWQIVQSLLLQDDTDASDEPETMRLADSDEWEQRVNNGVIVAEQLVVLDLRFSSLTTGNVLDILFREVDAPRFTTLAVLDLSYCPRVQLSHSFVRRFGRLSHLTHLALAGHEAALLSSPGSLSRLAAATPNLLAFEIDGCVPLTFIDYFAWSVLWQRLETLYLRGFRLPDTAKVTTGAQSQPRAGRLQKRSMHDRDEDEEVKRAEQALRQAIKRAGRTRWLDIVV